MGRNEKTKKNRIVVKELFKDSLQLVAVTSWPFPVRTALSQTMGPLTI